MPLYDYECEQCHRHTEKIQKFSDAPLTECPHCGGRLERVLHAPAVAFKGGGWYADGYGNAKPKSSGEGKTGEGKSESKSGETNSESSATKPASDTSSSSSPADAASSSAPAASVPAAASTGSNGSDKK